MKFQFFNLFHFIRVNLNGIFCGCVCLCVWEKWDRETQGKTKRKEATSHQSNRQSTAFVCIAHLCQMDWVKQTRVRWIAASFFCCLFVAQRAAVHSFCWKGRNGACAFEQSKLCWFETITRRGLWRGRAILHFAQHSVPLKWVSDSWCKGISSRFGC